MAVSTIRCRARIHPKCMNGRSWADPDSGPWEDGTWDNDSQTIVCDVCYVAIMPYSPSGQALLSEIPAAIEAARRAMEEDA